ncbi:MAG: sugar ABC transporter substrate-binding protein [Alphaproteobacteria bacterium]
MTANKTVTGLRALMVGAASAAVLCAFGATAQAEGVLNGQTIRIIGISDPVFQVMQKIHGQLEEMAGGTIELDVRPFDVLRQQILLNADNSESAYDIVAIDLPQFGEYKGFLRDLSPMIEASGMDMSDFYPAAAEGAVHDGRTLGISIQPHPEILAYRTDLFEAAGLAPPETTADVLAAAKALHGSRDGLAGICWNAARGTALGQTFIQVLGAHGHPPIHLTETSPQHFDIGAITAENMHPWLDDAAAQETAQYLVDLMPYSPPGILNMAWDERVRVFAQGGCAMTYIWSGRSAIYELDPEAEARGNVAYLPHPRGASGRNVSTLGGWYVGIPTNVPEDRVELAWKVIEWLTSPEMMTLYTENGDCVSPRFSVAADPEVVARCPSIAAVDQMARNDQIAAWQRPPVPELQAIVDVLGSEMHEMISGDKTPAEAIEESQSQVDRIMMRAGYY